VHHSGSGCLARPSPWGTFTSYSLPAFLAHSAPGQTRPRRPALLRANARPVLPSKRTQMGRPDRGSLGPSPCENRFHTASANTRHPKTCEPNLERFVRGTSLFRNGPVGSWEHGSRANHELQALFVALTLLVVPSVRFSLSPEFCPRSPGSSAFAAGQVKCQVTPAGA
jgi:hypothetical protein